MKLPEDVTAKMKTLPCWPENYTLNDIDAIEIIVRDCAKVCDEHGFNGAGPDPLVCQGCGEEIAGAILARYGLKP